MILKEREPGTFKDVIDTFDSLKVSDDTLLYSDIMTISWGKLKTLLGTGSDKGWGWDYDRLGRPELLMMQTFYQQDRRGTSTREAHL